MKKLIDKFRLFFVVSIVLIGFILLYPIIVCLCFIVNDKISKAIEELINKCI
jgi:nitrogen fixation/metabolism regulation signal transduction histidine kinase